MSPQITLYACTGGPNPPKIAFLLEELGIDYEVKILQFGEGDDNKPGVKHPSFLKINPNGRVPAIVDHSNGDFAVWESGAILQYLAETKGEKFIGIGKEKYEVLSWLAFQISGHGPMQGQVNYFKHFFKNIWGEESSPTVVKRFETETYRVFSVLETQLASQKAAGSDYLVGKNYTIADISFHGWLRTVSFAGLDLSPYPHVKAWVDRNEAKESTKRANKKIADAAAA
ncbi:glutathione S-transferase [Wallemia mellicola]|nr:glutathione S-transferase [Wallemia mellicola]